MVRSVARSYWCGCPEVAPFTIVRIGNGTKCVIKYTGPRVAHNPAQRRLDPCKGVRGVTLQCYAKAWRLHAGMSTVSTIPLFLLLGTNGFNVRNNIAQSTN